MNNKVSYVGRDLESMLFANNYHNWILAEFRPFLGNHLIEVGAGTGLFSEILLRENPQTISLVEPSEMFSYLQKNILQFKTNTSVTFYQSIFTQVADTIVKEQEIDSIIYVNVLEHIEDDLTELEKVYQTLKKRGKCFIFVPALMALYGGFDQAIGHYRRYKKTELEDKCKAVGFDIIKSKYIDLAGIVPWYARYKLLKSNSLDAKSVKLYDKIAVPVIRKFESIFRVPIGKNLLIIAEKTKDE